jgi:hypothetical protein
MKNLHSVIKLVVWTGFVTLFLFAGALTQASSSGNYSLEIIVDGVPLSEMHARGNVYIEAIEGREYSIRLSNHSSGRIAIALSVDGLNSIDAKTTSAGEATKWILNPYQTITIDGWQTNSSSARRFFFTTEERSYGAWLGNTSNLGLISAAVFREKLPQPSGLRRKERSAPRDQAETKRQLAEEQELSDDLAATGIGRKLHHQVQRVHFNSEQHPATVMELRYEYHSALVRLGVLPEPVARCDDPLYRRECSRGFTDTGFAPDPFPAECP